MPDKIIRKFEKKTGIKVNLNTYDSNETLYAKLKTTTSYDVIMPSSYYVDRMWHQQLLEKLDLKQLPHFKNINPFFLHKAYDPNARYSIPYSWGTTGIFINQKYYKTTIRSWANLWGKKWKNQLLLLDDPREVFSVGLISLSYSPNDPNPKHIEQAYHKLLALLPNVKLFASNTMQSLVIDEDANIGMVWNGDFLKAKKENANIMFIYPKDGFVIWIDCLAILKAAPHKKNAYQFLNFMLQGDIAKEASVSEGFATTNRAAFNLLPPSLQKNTLIYPKINTLSHGLFQSDIGDKANTLIAKYWQQLKMNA